MEKIPVTKLQELANMLHEEPSISLRNQLSAWATSNATNPEHAPLSSLASMAEQSEIKGKILEWVSNITHPKPEYIYVPDGPAQMTDEQAESVGELNNLHEIANDTIESLPEETQDEITHTGILEETGNVVDIKPKRTRKKKVD